MTDDVNNSAQAASPTPSPDLDLGARLRGLRMHQGLSQRELSRRAGVAHAAISQIEKNRVSPSVASLRKVVAALGLSLAEFFRSEAEGRQVFFAASELDEIGAGEVSLRLVGPRLPGRTLQVLVETYPPGADTSSEVFVQEGERGGVVVSGQITVTVGDESRVLGPGDAYQFPSTRPHRFLNEGPEACTIVSASTPPTH